MAYDFGSKLAANLHWHSKSHLHGGVHCQQAISLKKDAGGAEVFQASFVPRSTATGAKAQGQSNAKSPRPWRLSGNETFCLMTNSHTGFST
ncbi:MAG: hypothetical protein LAN62_00625 [Acidobacteriia bacterium]|nr:hypothetical protein [Terriglobia bacterium]